MFLLVGPGLNFKMQVLQTPASEVFRWDSRLDIHLLKGVNHENPTCANGFPRIILF